VVIVEDHPLFREGLASILSVAPEFKVVAQVGNLKEGKEAILKWTPEVALLDLSLPDGSGHDLLEWVRLESPITRVLIITMHQEPEVVAKAIECGAMGYLLKESSAENLLFAVRQVLSGETYIDSSIARRMLEKGETSIGKIENPSRILENLSPREKEIFHQLVLGKSVKEISSQLFISPKTVENHRTSILHKLNLRSTLELVRMAVRAGLTVP